ncbi:unnamed protein product [Paramecium pentaurelia]|uniref:Derlin n=1 Tax=Paramecium pentaurelia TaxID=43138 RepID=A0A8S1WHL9_9CILI|nr:unnamed protein product [Paramecium pentaurelia]
MSFYCIDFTALFFNFRTILSELGDIQQNPLLAQVEQLQKRFKVKRLNIKLCNFENNQAYLDFSQKIRKLQSLEYLTEFLIILIINKMVLEYILDIPPLTRIIVISSIILSYSTYVQYLKPSNLYLNYKLAFLESFQPWRILTSILYFGELDLITVLRLFFFQSISFSLEQHTFPGFANYLYFLLLNFVTITSIGLWLNEHSLTEYFVEALMYVWGRQKQERPLLCNNTLQKYFNFILLLNTIINSTLYKNYFFLFSLKLKISKQHTQLNKPQKQIYIESFINQLVKKQTQILHHKSYQIENG